LDLLNYFKDKKVVHVSDSDLDGISSRMIAEYYIKPICKQYTPFNTSDRQLLDFDLEQANKCDVVIFTDISPPDIEFYEKIKSRVFIFDHHISSREILGKLDNYYFDVTKCGTKIFFDKLLKGKRRKKSMQQYVDLVNIADLFHTESQDWKKARGLHNLMYSGLYVNWRLKDTETDTERYNKFILFQLMKIDKFENFYFKNLELLEIKKAEDKEKEAYKQAKKNIDFRADGEGNKYFYFECTSKISWVAYLLLKDYPDYDYCICHSTWGDNTKLSLRSNGKYSVDVLAKLHGGGGHKEASAVELKPELFEEFRKGWVHLI